MKHGLAVRDLVIFAGHLLLLTGFGAALASLNGCKGCEDPALVKVPPGLEPVPQEEICNGIDDDLDGQVDELLFRRVQDEDLCQYDTFSTADMPCHTNWVHCVDGKMWCIIDGGPRSETCNGINDDCDDETDEDLPVTFAYSGPAGTAGQGECRPSVSECRGGVEYTIAEILPHAEESGCGDEKDDDCDGQVDEDAQPRPDARLAVSLVVDVSGSMASWYADIRQGLCTFAMEAPAGSKFSMTVYGFGVAPGTALVSPGFVYAPELCTVLADNTHGSLSGGEEYQVEGVLAIPPWPPSGADEPELFRHVVLVSDETIHILENEVQDVVDQCSAGQYEFHAFVKQAYAFQWFPVLDACGGNPEHSLTGLADADLLLEEEFDEPCRD